MGGGYLLVVCMPPPGPPGGDMHRKETAAGSRWGALSKAARMTAARMTVRKHGCGG